MIEMRTGQHKSPFVDDKFKILRFVFNREGQMQDCLEEMMQSANKAWWRDVTIYRTKDVPWRAKC